MSTQLISRPAASAVSRPAEFHVRVPALPEEVATPAPARRSPFWLTDQQRSIADRNRELAQYTGSDRSLMGI